MNLFDLPVPETGESFRTLLRNGSLRIEAIVSSDTPEPMLYRQEQDEAVLLLSGGAVLWIDGREVTLRPGDFLHIPARTPHRVLKTEKGTRWLAIHMKEPSC